MKAIVRSMAACSLAVVFTVCARVAGPAAAAADARVGAVGAPCASTASCGEGKVCPTVCYGTCRPAGG